MRVIYFADGDTDPWIWSALSQAIERIRRLSVEERRELGFEGKIYPCPCKLHSDLPHAYLDITHDGLPILHYPFFSVRQVQETLGELLETGYLHWRQMLCLMQDVCDLAEMGLEEWNQPENEMAAAGHMYYDRLRKIFPHSLTRIN